LIVAATTPSWSLAQSQPASPVFELSKAGVACPRGTQAVATEAECEEAAAALERNQVSLATGVWPTFPSGCFAVDPGKLHFNTHPTGLPAANSAFVLVCRAASAGLATPQPRQPVVVDDLPRGASPMPPNSTSLAPASQGGGQDETEMMVLWFTPIYLLTVVAVCCLWCNCSKTRRYRDVDREQYASKYCTMVCSDRIDVTTKTHYGDDGVGGTSVSTYTTTRITYTYDFGDGCGPSVMTTDGGFFGFGENGGTAMLAVRNGTPHDPADVYAADEAACLECCCGFKRPRLEEGLVWLEMSKKVPRSSHLPAVSSPDMRIVRDSCGDVVFRSETARH